MPWIDNARIAAALREAGERLHERGGNAFSAAAYGRAAEAVEHSPQPMREIYQRSGVAGLRNLPGVGRLIGAAIAEMLATGRWRRLERLRAEDGACERSFLCTGADGLEHECVVLEPARRSALHGRDAIAELLGKMGH